MSRNEDLSDNELDAFDSRRQQILLDEAGDYAASRGLDSEESDEEVLVLGNNQSEEEDDESGLSEGEEGSEEGESETEAGWGSKKDYYGGDDYSDDDNAMTEEALRQQKKQLQELNMGDYLDEDMMADWEKTAGQHEAAGTGAQPEEDETVDVWELPEEDQLKHLNGLFPEFVPLLREFNKLSPQLETLKKGNEALQAKFVALSAYLSSISAYCSIFVDKLRNETKFSMKTDPVMESILTSREVWRQASQLSDVVMVDASEPTSESESESIADTEQFAAVDEAAADPTDSESENDSMSEPESLTDDEEQEADPTAKRSVRAPQLVDDYAENAADAADNDDKQRRKKSLRFYTSKIDQAAQKNARREKFDGDLDLPYRERLFERQQRLIEEARKRGLGLDKAQLGDALDDDAAADDYETARNINEDANDYYESIKQGKMVKKEARRTAHQEAKRAVREGRMAEFQETADAEGKRALNFQILKNKGLTANKKNENRNARVKKRKKYEQAKKKLKSVRAVYEQASGPYQGEKTGIKKNLSRSVKLK